MYSGKQRNCFEGVRSGVQRTSGNRNPMDDTAIFIISLPISNRTVQKSAPRTEQGFGGKKSNAVTITITGMVMQVGVMELLNHDYRPSKKDKS